MAASTTNHATAVPPLVEDKVLTPEEVSAATEQTENGDVITKDAFRLGLRRLLNLSIEGYPRAIRSTHAIRNEYLRKHKGAQINAVEEATADYGHMKETKNNEKSDKKDALFALVPYVGLPSSIILYAWTALRRCCLVAAIYGHDLSSEETRAKILYAYAGIRVTAKGVFHLEKATGVIWTAIAGPVVKAIPLPVAVAALGNVESYEITNTKNLESFKEGRIEVALEDYEQILDPEPTTDDYSALMLEGTLYAMLLARSQAARAWDIVTHQERDEADAWLAKATGEGKADDVKSFFAKIDSNGDGTIDMEEFLAYFKNKGMSADECKKLLAKIDTNSDGNISYDEFAAWVMKGSDIKIAAKHGIHYNESPMAMGSKAATKLRSGYEVAKDGVSKASVAVSRYATAAAEYCQGMKKMAQPAQGLGTSEAGKAAAGSSDEQYSKGAVAAAMTWAEKECSLLENVTHTGEHLLHQCTPCEIEELFKAIKVDSRLDMMKPSTRLLISFAFHLVQDHANVEAKDIRVPATKNQWDANNTVENATAGVILPSKDEQSSHGVKDCSCVSDVDQLFMAGFSKLPIVDVTFESLQFGCAKEGILFAQKLLGPVLPKPRYAWNELASDQAQADIAYFGIGQLHLQASDDSSYEHMIDMRSMASLAVRSPFAKYGAAAYFCEGNLVGIERGGTFFRSDSSEWEHVKFAWRSSLFTWVTVVEHLVFTHLVVSNGINAASREMPPEHPVRRVLHVNIFGSSAVNALSNITLANDGGFLHRMSALEWTGGLDNVISSSKNFKFETWPQRFEASTLPGDVKRELPLFKHGLAVWEALRKFYGRYVDVFYESDDAVLGDEALVSYWRFRCSPQYTQGLPALSKTSLADQLTHACFYVTAFHQVVGDVVQYVTTPRGMFFQFREGQTMADAEMLATTLALTASTGRFMPSFMSDWSHLLDSNREVQNSFQALMNDLQQVSKEIEGWNKESRIPFTELDPALFESSVSI